MGRFLGYTAIVLYLLSFGSCALAKSSVHEIGSLVTALIATVMLVGAAIIEAITRLETRLAKALNQVES